MTITAPPTAHPAAAAWPCPTCGYTLPLPQHPAVCPVCLVRRFLAQPDADPVALLPQAAIPITPTTIPELAAALADARHITRQEPDIPSAWASACRLLGAPSPRFCSPNCAESYADAIADGDRGWPHTPGRCWCCTGPVMQPDLRFLLAQANISENYYQFGAYPLTRIGHLVVVAVQTIWASHVMGELASGMRLADPQCYHHPLHAIAAATAEVARHPAPVPPPPPHPIVYWTFTGGVTLQAHAIAIDGRPILETLIQTTAQPGVLWTIRIQHARLAKLDEELRRFGVRHATLTGPRLWLELGMPLPPRRVTSV